MDSSTAPFEVVCIDSGNCTIDEDGNEIPMEPQPVIGQKYTVVHTHEHCNIIWYILAGFDENCFYDSAFFRKINPYQSSVSRELAERAVESIGDGQDMKPVTKEVVNS